MSEAAAKASELFTADVGRRGAGEWFEVTQDQIDSWPHAHYLTDVRHAEAVSEGVPGRPRPVLSCRLSNVCSVPAIQDPLVMLHRGPDR